MTRASFIATSLLNAAAKVLLFSDMRKFFVEKNVKHTSHRESQTHPTQQN
jgi:hypothetical protein